MFDYLRILADAFVLPLCRAQKFRTSQAGFRYVESNYPDYRSRVVDGGAWGGAVVFLTKVVGLQAGLNDAEGAGDDCVEPAGYQQTSYKLNVHWPSGDRMDPRTRFSGWGWVESCVWDSKL